MFNMVLMDLTIYKITTKLKMTELESWNQPQELL